MDFLTMLLCLACAYGAYEAAIHRVWWALPFAVIGCVFFFLAASDED